MRLEADATRINAVMLGGVWHEVQFDEDADESTFRLGVYIMKYGHNHSTTTLYVDGFEFWTPELERIVGPQSSIEAFKCKPSP